MTLYPWSGLNDYFFQGKTGSFVIGAEDGHFGIYVDGDLNKGRIQSCTTFKDWPKKEKDFTLKFFECWNFI